MELRIGSDVSGLFDGTEVGTDIHQIQNLDVDMVVIGRSERSPVDKAMFEDHAQKLLLNVPCPMLYVKQS